MRVKNSRKLLKVAMYLVSVCGVISMQDGFGMAVSSNNNITDAKYTLTNNSGDKYAISQDVFDKIDRKLNVDFNISNERL